MRTCPKCGIEKPLDAEHYYRNSSKPSGFKSWCKVCSLKQQAEYRSCPEVKERRAEYDAERNSRPEIKERNALNSAENYQNNKERILKQQAERYQNNKERILKQQAEYRSRPEVKERKAEYRAEYYSRPGNKEANRLRCAKRNKEAKSNQPACVYQIVNTATNKIYIGQTTQGELRWKAHLSRLRGNCHRNPKLQADFNKFGEDAFKWSIIKEYPKDKELLESKERQLIKQYEKEGKQLYNILITENK